MECSFYHENSCPIYFLISMITLTQVKHVTMNMNMNIYKYIYIYAYGFLFFVSNQYGPCGQYIVAGRYVSGTWRLIASVETMPCPDSIDITKYSVVMPDGQFMSYLRHILQGHIYLHYILPHIGISEACIWLGTPCMTIWVIILG